MYNELIKKKYLEIQDSDFVNVASLFNQVEKLEKQEDNDIFNIPTDEILKYIMEQGQITSLQTLRKKYEMIKKYKQWAIISNYIDKDLKYFDPKINVAELFVKYNKTAVFKSPKQLRDELSKYLSNTSTEGISSDELCLLYMYLLYQGFTKYEICELKLSDIISSNNYVLIKNSRIAVKVYDEFKPLLDKVCKNRIYAKMSIYDNSSVKMNELLISLGDFPPERALYKIPRIISRKVLPNIKFRVDDLFIMGRVYEGKLFNKTLNEIYRDIEESIPGNKVQFKKRMKLIYDNW